MVILLEIMKGIFFFLTMALALLILKWSLFFSEDAVRTLHQILMPCYLLLCWIMLWYILWLLRLAHDVDEERSEELYRRSFLVGMWIGLVFCVLYIFVI